MMLLAERKVPTFKLVWFIMFRTEGYKDKEQYTLKKNDSTENLEWSLGVKRQ